MCRASFPLAEEDYIYTFCRVLIDYFNLLIKMQGINIGTCFLYVYEAQRRSPYTVIGAMRRGKA